MPQALSTNAQLEVRIILDVHYHVDARPNKLASIDYTAREDEADLRIGLPRRAITES